MNPGLRNFVGLVGLVLLLFYGPSLVRASKTFSPFAQMPAAWTCGERQSLIVLGVVVVLILLVIKASRGGGPR